MKSLDDIELLYKIKEDNRLAFKEVVDRYSDILFRFIYKRTNCVEDTKDILQDLFASLWHCRYTIQVEKSLYPYLYKSAKYAVIDWLARNERQLERLANLLAHATFEKNSLSFEDELMAKELSQRIDNEVDKMPKTMRSVYRMSRNQAMTNKQIAIELTISEQTVKNNITLAINKLRLKFK